MTTPITKADVKALKTCNRVVFRYKDPEYWDYARNPDQKLVSQIELIKEKSDSDPWEQRHDIQVGFRLNNYEKGEIGYAVECGSLYRWSEGDEHLATIFDFIKEGDVLTLSWQAGAGNSDLIREADLHHDRLYLNIERGKKKMTFLVFSNVAKDNSARMIQFMPNK